MFSLFEWKRQDLVFVGGVLLIIFIVSFFQLRIGQMKSRDVQRKNDTQLVARSLDNYFRDHDVFPRAMNGQIVACGDLADVACLWGEDGVRDFEGVVYIKELPQDVFVKDGRKYVYEVSDDLKHYRVYAALEYSQDEDWKENLTTECGSGLQCNWYAGNY